MTLDDTSFAIQQANPSSALEVNPSALPGPPMRLFGVDLGWALGMLGRRIGGLGLGSESKRLTHNDIHTYNNIRYIYIFFFLSYIYSFIQGRQGR